MFPLETEFQQLRPEHDESSEREMSINLYLKETDLYSFEFKDNFLIHCLFWIHFM
jgi:hypothetical protein